MFSHESLIILQQATKRVHTRKSLPIIWNIYIKFAQKYYSSITLSMWVVYEPWVSKNLMCLKMWYFTFFDIMSQAKTVIYKKKLYRVFVKFSEEHRGSVTVNFTKCGKLLNGVKNVIMQGIYFLIGPLFNLFFCHIVLYWENVTSD